MDKHGWNVGTKDLKTIATMKDEWNHVMFQNISHINTKRNSETSAI